MLPLNERRYQQMTLIKSDADGFFNEALLRQKAVSDKAISWPFLKARAILKGKSLSINAKICFEFLAEPSTFYQSSENAPINWNTRSYSFPVHRRVSEGRDVQQRQRLVQDQVRRRNVDGHEDRGSRRRQAEVDHSHETRVPFKVRLPPETLKS